MSKAKGLLNNYSRLGLLIVAVVFGVSLIAQNVNVFGRILLVVIGFGAVVLVHEFGHFIVAKLSGIKVEAFSIGFSPILAGIKRSEDGFRVRILPQFFPKEDSSDGGLLSFTVGKKTKPGETEYRIGLIPFGGFNKMLGQEDTKTPEATDNPRSYANKPVGVRMAVIAAGVLFNVISAVIVFMIVFLIGINRIPAVVGGVKPDSPAARAGLKAGDEIIEVAGKSKNLEFMNVMVAAALSGRNEEVALKVKHEDGSVEDFAIAAEQTQTPTGQMRLFGISIPQCLTVAKLSGSEADDLFAKTGLLAGDRIKAVNGRDVQTHWQMEEIVRNSFARSVTIVAERIEPVSKEVELIEARIRLTLNLQDKKDKKESEGESDLGNIYSMVPRMQITAVNTEVDLQSGDIVLAVGDVENPTYKEMRDITTEYEDKQLSVKVLRVDSDGSEKVVTVAVVPKRSRDDGRVLIGIGVELDFERAVVAKTIAVEDRPAALAIPRGATITAVEGVSVSNFYDVAREIGQYAGQCITIDYRLNEKTSGDVALDVGGDKGFAPVKCTFAEFIPFEPLQRLYQANGPINAIAMGFSRTVMFIVQTYVTLQRLILGLASPKSFMGPVGIAKVSYDIVKNYPLIYYAHFLGIISVLIGAFNSLPLLPFDGGHIVFLLVEKIKGSAVSERVQGAILYTGLVIVIAFILYVTFNDIVRSFF